MGQANNTPERIAVFVTNFHPRATTLGPLDVEREEEAVNRLARDFVSGSPPWRMSRVGSRFETAHASAQVVIKEELRRALSGVLQPPIVLLHLAGHGVLHGPAQTPALLARDVHLHMKEDGVIDLRWFVDAIADAGPAHAVLLLDLEMLDGLQPPVAQLARCLQPVPFPHTLFIADRTAGRDRSFSLLLAAAVEGAGMDLNTGFVSVRSLNRALSQAADAQHGPPVVFQTTLPQDQDLELLAPPAVSTFPSINLPEGELDTIIIPRPGPLARGMVLPGKVRLEEMSGAGSFGVGFSAEQIDLQRKVAVKVLQHSASLDFDSIVLFVREMRSVASLQHRGIVSIYGSDKLPDGRLFYVMELVQGDTLRKRLERERRLPVDKTIDIAFQLLSALAHAHKKGIIHRDIKPENVMLVPEETGGERVVILDFGIARWKEERSRSATATDLSAGTPGYMPPEQIEGRRVDEAADIFAVGVCMCEMLAGARPSDLAPGTGVSDALVALHVPGRLRNAVLRAIQPKPADRFHGCEDFIMAIQGRDSSSIQGAERPPALRPFRFLSSFNEEDSPHFFGREAEVQRMVDRILFTRAIILTGPSGVGKSSLLKAGVIPRCKSLRMKAVHVECRRHPVREIIDLLAPGHDNLVEACRTAAAENPERIVIIVDQVESLYVSDAFTQLDRDAFEQALLELLETRSLPVCVVLSVRDDFLAYLAPLRRRLGLSAYSELRLELLAWDQARTAITQPLRMAGVTVSDDLLLTLRHDLSAASRQMGLAARQDDTVYPPHLQLACSLLFDALEPGDKLLTQAHYERAGSIQGILQGHLHSILDRELSRDEARAARTLIKELVSTARTRALRSDAELRSAVSARHSQEALSTVLRVLSQARLASPVTIDGQLHWELVHDCLVQEALSWADAQDLQRKKNRELLRLNLYHSTRSRPSFLSRGQLRDLRTTLDVIPEMDREIAALPPGSRPLLPASALHAASLRHHRRVTTCILTAAVAALAVIFSLVGLYWHDLNLRVRNQGIFYLRFQPFDWDAEGNMAPAPIRALTQFDWSLHDPGDPARNPVGHPVPAEWIERREVPQDNASTLLQRVSAPGGRRVLVIYGRNGPDQPTCPPSIIPIEDLPGFTRRAETDAPERAIEILFPTCAASRRNTVPVPAGRFYMGSRDPKMEYPLKLVELADYLIDRYEVANGQFNAFDAFARNVTRLTKANYGANEAKTGLRSARDPGHPAADLSWQTARDYCLWLGKDLPSDAQWEKAARGGIYLDGDAGGKFLNASPYRIFPWGDESPEGKEPDLVAYYLTAGRPSADYFTLPVTCCARGVSPYGVHNLSGNILEWTRDWYDPRFYVETASLSTPLREPVGAPEGEHRLVRGGFTGSRSVYMLQVDHPDHLAAGNSRLNLGFRCAEHSPASSWTAPPGR